MPYFVYKIAPVVSKIVKNLQPLEEFEKFKDAKLLVKAKRQDETENDGSTYKIIFAEDIIDAEEKLQQQRDEPIKREWEK